MLPPGTLQGRVAIITGGSSGLGLAMARCFGDLGASLVLAARNAERLAGVAKEFEAKGVPVLTVPMDVRDPSQVDELLARTLERFRRVDILVNNAAGNFVCPAHELSVNGWNAVVNIVLNGTFYCSRAVGRHWISAAAKAGVLAMTRTLAVEWAPYRIRVNAIAPGPIDKTGGAY